MNEDRVVMRGGELVCMPPDELDALLHAAFTAAVWSALKLLDATSDEGPAVDSIRAETGFGNDFIITHVRLVDGREASASASIWPDQAQPN